MGKQAGACERFLTSIGAMPVYLSVECRTYFSCSKLNRDEKSALCFLLIPVFLSFDRGTRRQGDKETRRRVFALPVSLGKQAWDLKSAIRNLQSTICKTRNPHLETSPSLLVSLSPCLRQIRNFTPSEVEVPKSEISMSLQPVVAGAHLNFNRDTERQGCLHQPFNNGLHCFNLWLVHIKN